MKQVTRLEKFLTAILLCCTLSNCEKDIDGSKLTVNHGTQECISSDCSKSYPMGDILHCSLEECGLPAISEDTAEKPTEEGVSFQIFRNEKTGTNDLALRVQWSPSDDATLERTTGYRVRISDGFSTYYHCYNITSPMLFARNLKDIFYNDCFGKASNTKVLLGSRIRVSVAALPLWIHDKNDTELVFHVKVPDCNFEPFLNLTNCEDELNMRKDCATDCSTFSVGNDNVIYPISCLISQKQGIHTSSLPEKCPDVNRTADHTPSEPRNLSVKYYKYLDQETGEIKLALNFTWNPGADGSIQYLIGFYLEVLHEDVDGHDLTSYNKCYSIQTQLEEDKHDKAEFFHDCYGRDLQEVEPKHGYLIHLNSVPSKQDSQFITARIEIPSCADPNMQDVTACVNENSMRLEGDVEEIFCDNRSMRYRYHVSPDYGTSAMVTFCEKGKVPTQMCQVTLDSRKKLPLSGVIYDFALPSSANLSINYSVFVSGNIQNGFRHYDYPDFTQCIKPPPPDPQQIAVLAVILVLVVLIIIGLALLLCVLYRRKCADNRMSKIFRRFKSTQGQDVQYNPPINNGKTTMNPLKVQVPIVEPEPVKENVRVYVLFMDDHDLHRDVIHWFCSFLKADLGIKVTVSIWQTEAAAQNPAQYMMTNLKRAEKVIIICSAGTRSCLIKKELNGDHFTPAVRQIINEAFVGKNPGKFLVGYFDYSSPEDVPEMLRDQTMMYCSLFKLMKQFESFYFRLIGKEQYQEGGIQRINKIAFDQYYDPKLNTCGFKLKEAIDKMIQFVHENPTWYTDNQGLEMAGSDLPPEPLPGPPVRVMPAEDDYDGRPSINHLQLSLPPEIQNSPQDATGAKQKIMNNAARDQPIMTQYNPAPEGPQSTRPKYVDGYSPLSEDTSGSFMISETEVEKLSLDDELRQPNMPNGNMLPNYSHPSNFGPSPSFGQPNSRLPIQNDYFYQPSHFTSNSFPSETIDSEFMTNFPSNETQVTRIGLPESVDQDVLGPSLVMMTGLQNNQLPYSHGAESGVFTLANIDEDEDNINFEHEFKSINESNH